MGYSGSIEQKIIDLVTPIIKEEGCELWDVAWTNDHGRWVLRVMLEKEGGITVGDCAKVSRSIEDLIEVKAVIACAYELEVSSPGLDRPLKKKEHFKAVIGKVIRVKTSSPIHERRNYKGILKSIKEDDFIISIDQQDFVIPFDQIQKANLEY